MAQQTIAQLKKQIAKFEVIENLPITYPISGLLIHNSKDEFLNIEAFNLEDAVKINVTKKLNVTMFINEEKPITFCNFSDKTEMLLFGNLKKELQTIILGEVLTSFYK